MNKPVPNFAIDLSKVIWISDQIIKQSDHHNTPETVTFSFDVKATDMTMFKISRQFQFKEMHMINGEKLFDGSANQKKLYHGEIKFYMLKEYDDFKKQHETLLIKFRLKTT